LLTLILLSLHLERAAKALNGHDVTLLQYLPVLG
jgi:hypothetical protein